MSNHNDLEKANKLGTAIDYLGVGPVFATTTKTDAAPVIRPKGLWKICADSKYPVVTIGGICKDNIEKVMSGPNPPDGIAVVSAICSADDSRKASAELLEAINRHRKN